MKFSLFERVHVLRGGGSLSLTISEDKLFHEIFLILKDAIEVKILYVVCFKTKLSGNLGSIKDAFSLIKLTVLTC